MELVTVVVNIDIIGGGEIGVLGNGGIITEKGGDDLGGCRKKRIKLENKKNVRKESTSSGFLKGPQKSVIYFFLILSYIFSHSLRGQCHPFP